MQLLDNIRYALLQLSNEQFEIKSRSVRARTSRQQKKQDNLKTFCGERSKHTTDIINLERMS